MHRKITFFLFIAVILLGLFVLIYSLFHKSWQTSSDSNSSPLPNYFYLQPVKFVSIDEDRKVKSSYSETSLGLDSLQIHYFGILKRDGWEVNQNEAENGGFVLLASRKIPDSSSKEFAMVTATPLISNDNPSLHTRVTVSYWKK